MILLCCLSASRKILVAARPDFSLMDQVRDLTSLSDETYYNSENTVCQGPNHWIYVSFDSVCLVLDHCVWLWFFGFQMSGDPTQSFIVHLLDISLLFFNSFWLIDKLISDKFCIDKENKTMQKVQYI